MAHEWRTADGTKIPIHEMADSHLLNALQMLSKFGRCKRAHLFPHLLAEAKNRKLDLKPLNLKQPSQAAARMPRGYNTFMQREFDRQEAEQDAIESGGYIESDYWDGGMHDFDFTGN